MTILIKKYANRRLYDTTKSTYINLDDLAALLAMGHDLQVVDVKTGEDLTQSTLAQVLFETKQIAPLLDADVLTSLIRMTPEDLARFFGSHLNWALGVYDHLGTTGHTPNPELATLSHEIQELKTLVHQALHALPSPASKPP